MAETSIILQGSLSQETDVSRQKIGVHENLKAILLQYAHQFFHFDK